MFLRYSGSAERWKSSDPIRSNGRPTELFVSNRIGHRPAATGSALCLTATFSNTGFQRFLLFRVEFGDGRHEILVNTMKYSSHDRCLYFKIKILSVNTNVLPEKCRSTRKIVKIIFHSLLNICVNTVNYVPRGKKIV